MLTPSKKQILVTTLSMASALGLAGCGATGADSTASRLTLMNKQLSITAPSSNTRSANTITVNPGLSLVATLTPPVVNGTTLQANNVFSTGVNAYVAYNIAGAGSGGGIDIVNVSVPTIPALGNSTVYPNVDVNGTYVYGTTLYAAAQSTVASTPGILNQYALGLLGGSITGLTSTTALPSYAGVAVNGDIGGNYLYVISGDDTDASGAGLKVLNRSSLTAVTGGSTEIFDARDVAVRATDNNVYVVAGQPGRLLAFNGTGTQASGAMGLVSLGGATIAQSKSTVQVGVHYAAVTSGDGGASIVCLDNMQVLAHVAPPTATYGTSVTNGAVFTTGMLITADGDKGVNVYQANVGSAIALTSCQSITLTLVGSINFGTSVSANSIKAVGPLLFVGAGIGGYQIISVSLPVITTGLLTSL